MSEVDKNTIELKPGEVLIKERDPCDGLYIIKSGQLEVYKTNKNGDKIPLAIIGSGEYAGELAILMESAHTSSVAALTEVKAVRLPKAKIEVQLKAVPIWLLALTKGLVKRLMHANELLRKNGVIDEATATKISAVSAQAQRDQDSKKSA